MGGRTEKESPKVTVSSINTGRICSGVGGGLARRPESKSGRIRMETHAPACTGVDAVLLGLLQTGLRAGRRQ